MRVNAMLEKKILFVVLLAMGVVPAHAQGNGGALESSQNNTSAERPSLMPGSDEYWDKLVQFEVQLKAVPITEEGYSLFEKLRSDFLNMGNEYPSYRRTIFKDRQLGAKNNEVAQMFVHKKIEFFSLYPPSLRTGAQDCYTQMMQYENQIPRLPITKEGLTTYQKISSDFSNMMRGEKTCFDQIVSNNDLQDIENDVAVLLLAKETEFKALKKSADDNQSKARETELAKLVEKYHSKIEKLGFSKAFLASPIYLRTDAINQPTKIFTFEVWLAGLFDSAKYSSITKITANKSEGVLLKRQGMPSAGILFKFDGGNLFPSHVTTGNKAELLGSPEDQVAASVMILNAVEH